MPGHSMGRWLGLPMDAILNVWMKDDSTMVIESRVEVNTYDDEAEVLAEQVERVAVLNLSKRELELDVFNAVNRDGRVTKNMMCDMRAVDEQIAAAMSAPIIETTHVWNVLTYEFTAGRLYHTKHLGHFALITETAAEEVIEVAATEIIEMTFNAAGQRI